ncbi:MAG: shikimate kinase [Bacillota bacterium]
MIEKIVLIGAIATGKTAIGKSLAEKLEMFFATTDELLEYENGEMTDLAKMFGKEGVEKYTNRTLSGLKDLQNAVIVAYDNCLDTDDKRAMISENSLVVHLYASSEVVFTRLKKQGKKGVYSIYEIEEIQRNLVPVYNKMADMKISINRKTQDAIVMQIVKSLTKFVDKMDD